MTQDLLYLGNRVNQMLHKDAKEKTGQPKPNCDSHILSEPASSLFIH